MYIFIIYKIYNKKLEVKIIKFKLHKFNFFSFFLKENVNNTHHYLSQRDDKLASGIDLLVRWYILISIFSFTLVERNMMKNQSIIIKFGWDLLILTYKIYYLRILFLFFFQNSIISLMSLNIKPTNSHIMAFFFCYFTLFLL